MKFTCTTNKNKQVELTQTDGKLFMDSKEIKNIKTTYFYPCALNRGDAHLIVLLDDGSGQNKTYFFRRNWLSKPVKKMDDDVKVVNELNAAMQVYASDILTHENSFEGQFDKVWEMTDIFIVPEGILSPAAKIFKDFKYIDCVFFERVTSYTRSFDISLIFGDSKLGISAVNRKKSLQLIKDKLSSASDVTNVYETGPDPLPWDNLFRQRKNTGVSWQQIHEMVSNQEDDEFDNESDWAPGETDEEEDEEEYDYPSEEEEEEENFTDDDDLSDVLEDNDDYDTYETKTKKKKRTFGSDSDDEYEPVSKKTKV